MGQAVIYYALLSLACGFALWRGGGPERVVALLFVVASIASDNAYAIGQDKYLSVEVGVLAIDLTLLACLVAVMLLANRFWPIAMVSLHGLGVVAHWVRAQEAGMIPPTYNALLSLWSYPMLLILVVATIRHRRRRRRHGADRSWRRSSRRPASSPGATPGAS
ncbi:MAG TPA: hypothetical protein VLG14_14780 [Sphingomonas sp.]|nr:hypothetical protein [Sphingomonas sp.]